MPLSLAATFDSVHSNFLALRSLALSSWCIQYVSCAYARKFKYLLFVIKFGKANAMGILHRDCMMQRDRPRLFVRGNDDLHIDRYFVLLLPHFATGVYRFSPDSPFLLYFSFPVSLESRGSPSTRVVLRDILVLPSSPFNPYS